MLRESIFVKVKSGEVAVGIICRSELVPSQIASSLEKLRFFSSQKNKNNYSLCYKCLIKGVL